MLTREQPWHTRFVTAEHERRFRNLLDFQALTSAWLAEHELGEAPIEPKIEKLLDDTSPDDLLSRLERAAWASQAAAISQIRGQGGKSDWASNQPGLEQQALKAGKAAAQARWGNLRPGLMDDLRQVLLAFRDSPLSGYPRRENILIRRALASEIELELLECPHRIGYPEVEPAADALCGLHAHWTRGFAQALNPKVSVDYHAGQGKKRCQYRWFLPA